VTAGFVRSQDLNDGRFSLSVSFVSLRDFNHSQFCFIRRFQ